jgi:DDE superfamily endonuclease
VRDGDDYDPCNNGSAGRFLIAVAIALEAFCTASRGEPGHERKRAFSGPPSFYARLLAVAQSLSTALSNLHRFFANVATVLTWRAGERGGSVIKAVSIRAVSSLSTRPGAKTNMTRTRGWAPRGKRLVAKAPFGKWRTLTFLAALRHDRIEAPVLFDGRINGRKFRAYVEEALVPTLKPDDRGHRQSRQP